MACGIVVVAHNNGGYREWIIHGKNVFLFSTPQEAFDIILTLKNDISLRKRIGQEARKTVESMLGEGKINKMKECYLNDKSRILE